MNSRPSSCHRSTDWRSPPAHDRRATSRHRHQTRGYVPARLRDAGIDHIQPLFIGREAQPVRSHEIIRHHVRRAARRIEAIHVARQFRHRLVAFVRVGAWITASSVAAWGEGIVPVVVEVGGLDVEARSCRRVDEPVYAHPNYGFVRCVFVASPIFSADSVVQAQTLSDAASPLAAMTRLRPSRFAS